jgi:hypothetical protein
VINNKQLERLGDCTGAKAVAIYTCGHINDTAYPCFRGVGGMDEFCVDVLSKTPGELSCQLDAWAISQEKSEYPKSPVYTLLMVLVSRQ